ncbi:putative pectinesterase/pectinesterase inhibitor 21 [Bienertia sinuspersici]
MSRDHEFNVKEQKKRKVAVVALSSAMLLAMVVAVTVGIKETGHVSMVGTGDDDHDGLATSSRAAKSVCHIVEYRRACERTLAHAHTSEPKKLVQTTFNAAIEKLETALANSTTIKPPEDDRRGEGALETCKELMEYAVADLKRSIDQMGRFGMHKQDEQVENMRIWLSGAMTYQETCIDAFENTTQVIRDKMKTLLNTSRELTSNGLDVASGLTTILQSLNVSAPAKHHRLLLEEGEKENEGDELPHWMDEQQRKLLHEEGASIKANVVVAKDGSGKYKTIMEALKEAPVVKDVNKVATSTNKTFVIYIKEGIYEEEIRVEARMTNVMFIGDGPTKTKITGKKSFADGFVLYKTATVCTVDFIFGNAAAVFQNCKLVIRKPLDNQECVITAQARVNDKEPTGFVLQNCTVMADPMYYPVRDKNKAFLGRPCKRFSRAVYMQSYLGDSIAPQGWKPWMGSFGQDTCVFAEFENRGPASDLSARVKWRGVHKLTKQEVVEFTPAKFYGGDRWILPTGVPYVSGIMPS